MIGAGFLIGKSYLEWQKNPIATSITTQPIDDLDFPIVTVCPPKGSNTAHYHDLVKAGNETISEEHRKTLKDSAYQIFMKDSHQLYITEMLATANMGNMDQILQGFHSLPIPYDTNGLKINAQNVNGTITTLWFQGIYVEEYFRDNRNFLIFLEFPDDIKDQIGGGSLIIELEVDVQEEKGWTEDVRMFTFHVNSKSWLEAELECQREGGNLVSVTSDEMNQLVKHMAGRFGWEERGSMGCREESGYGPTSPPGGIPTGTMGEDKKD